MTQCGRGTWTCVLKSAPASDSKKFHYNKHPHYCLPKAGGECKDMASCEATCGSSLAEMV